MPEFDHQWLLKADARRNLRAEALAATDRANDPKKDERDDAEFERRHPIVGILN